MDISFISFLASITPRQHLVNHLQEALTLYKTMPEDSNFQRLTLCATLLAMKEVADGNEVKGLLQQMVSDTIPFLNRSAN